MSLSSFVSPFVSLFGNFPIMSLPFRAKGNNTYVQSEKQLCSQNHRYADAGFDAHIFYIVLAIRMQPVQPWRQQLQQLPLFHQREHRHRP